MEKQPVDFINKPHCSDQQIINPEEKRKEPYKWWNFLVMPEKYIGKNGAKYEEKRARIRTNNINNSYSVFGLSERIRRFIQSEENECHFSINTLQFFREHCREFLNHGYVPTVRLNEFDQYGIPVYANDTFFKDGEIPREFPENTFIVLTKCPEDFEISNFVKPLDKEIVMDAAEKGTLGFTNEYSNTSHMTVASLIYDKKNPKGRWSKPAITPNSKYACDKLEQIKQYGTGLFEGIGVEMTDNGGTAIFRLDEHAKRMYNGARFFDIFPDLNNKETEEERYAEFKQMFEKMVMDTIRANWEYIPSHGKGRLYIRPDFWDHGPKMHADNSNRYGLLMCAIPIGSAESYFDAGLKSFFMPKGRARVAEGCSIGTTKATANYGQVVKLMHSAKKKGHAGVIFTNSAGTEIKETNASSLLFIIKKKDESCKLITPKLDGTVLDSVTRKSCMALAKNELNWEVEEKTISPEYIKALAIARDNKQDFDILKKIVEYKNIQPGKKIIPFKPKNEIEEMKKLMDERTDLWKLAEKLTKEDIKEFENVESFEAVAAGTGVALTKIDQIQIGKVDPETDEVKKENYEDLILIDPEKTGNLDPASKILFDLLLKAKSGKFQKEMREELNKKVEILKEMQKTATDKEDNADEEMGYLQIDFLALDIKLKEYESWLTLVPPPRKDLMALKQEMNKQVKKILTQTA